MQARSFAVGWVLALAGACVLSVAPTVGRAQGAADATPQEVDGQINGQKARFLANGDDVLVSVAEADRLGLHYRDGKSVSIGGTPLWIVALDSVTVAGKTRLSTPAGVVPNIAGYFAALRAHPAEAFARSREMLAEINGVSVKAYDLGASGVLVTPAEATRAGLDYRRGKQQNVGPVEAWVIDALVKTGASGLVTTAVTVAEAEPFFEAAMAAARSGK